VTDLFPAPVAYTVMPEPFDSPDAQRLRAVARIEVDAMYKGYPDLGAALTVSSVAANFVARDAAGVPLGCGALVEVNDGVMEIRRMYVRSEARGTGVATALLRAIENAGRELGAPALVYETGVQQTRTIRFYEREGFYRIAPYGPYGENPLSVCLAKPL
jgi:putative acetyltransferase